MRASKRGGRIILSMTMAEGEKIGLVSRNATVVASTPAATAKVRIACITPGCYKEGHAFSAIGAYGSPTAKGHFDLNPTHEAKSL